MHEDPELPELRGQVIRLTSDLRRLERRVADLEPLRREVGDLRAKSQWPTENTEVRNLRALEKQTLSERAKSAEERAELTEFRLHKTRQRAKWWAGGGAAILFAVAKLIEAIATGKIQFHP